MLFRSVRVDEVLVVFCLCGVTTTMEGVAPLRAVVVVSDAREMHSFNGERTCELASEKSVSVSSQQRPRDSRDTEINQ